MSLSMKFIYKSKSTTQQFLFNLENEFIELSIKDISLQKSFSKLFVAFKGFYMRL